MKGKVTIALAPEMAGFAWAMLQTVEWPGEAPTKAAN
jgi:transposase